MKISGYDIDLEKAVKIIKKNDYKHVVLQIPEGLKLHFSKFVEFLESKTNTSIMISADPCFGACDLIDYKFENFDIDFIIQIGHTPIPNNKNPSIHTLFLNAKLDISVEKVVKKSFSFLKGKKIGVVTTAQHLHKLDEIKTLLKTNNYEPIVGKGNGRIAEKGQILGCDFTSGTTIGDKVDSFLFIGSGMFHPLGLLLTTKKSVIVADPYTNEVKKEELDELKDIILRQRYGAIARSKDAKNIGIIISTKKGQQRMKLANKIKDEIDKKGKKSYFIVLDNLSFDLLQSFKSIDCFVSTACPRVAIDDYLQYKVPILTPIELEIVLGIRKWEDYTFDQILA